MTTADVSSAPLLRVRNLQVSFDDRGALRRAVGGVSFDLPAGGCVALVGESGSGKSVTARSLLGLNGATARVRADELSLQGRNLLALGERGWRGIRGRAIGYVLQDALVSLDPLRTIGQELQEALRATGTTARSAALRAQAIALLSQARMPDPEVRFDEHPSQLSGGLRQRALIATALAGNPSILIADEPTTALDASVQQEILDLFATLRRQGTALLLISHDLGVVSQLADDVLVLRHGAVVESGGMTRVLRQPSHPYTRALINAIPHFERVEDAGVDPAASTSSSMSTPAYTTAALTQPFDAAPVMLRAVGIRKQFQSRGSNAAARVALDGVSIELRRGRTLGLVGESGSGKTTLARIIAGLDVATGGDVFADDLPPSPAPSRARPIQFMYQDPLSAFDPRYTVGRIIGEALWMRFGREDAARQRGRIDAWLDKVGLDRSLAERRPLTLSGGQRQRVALARALATEPQIVVLDEPVSALDVVVQKQILDLILALQRETRVAFLLISHDLGVIQRMSDDVAVLRHGQLREYGDAETVLRHPRDPYTRQLIDAVAGLLPRAEEAA